MNANNMKYSRCAGRLNLVAHVLVLFLGAGNVQDKLVAEST
jgi:hypothetical protein